MTLELGHTEAVAGAYAAVLDMPRYSPDVRGDRYSGDWIEVDAILAMHRVVAQAAMDRRDAATRESSLREALQAIADLPRGHTEEVCEGHEQVYRAIEALISNK